MSHTHSFDPSEWPFEKSIDSTAYSTKYVVHHGYPILTVAHDREGDWQFLCGTTNDPDDMSIICLGCMYELDRSIGQFNDLPRGWIAWRDSEQDQWQREPMAEDDDED